jgi:hypothetical protein
MSATFTTIIVAKRSAIKVHARVPTVHPVTGRTIPVLTTYRLSNYSTFESYPRAY